MSQQGGVKRHRGILFRGANGSLWFIRDDWDAPKQLDPATKTTIEPLLGPQSQWSNPPLSRAAINVLDQDPQYGPIVLPDGVIHHCATTGP
jgi:hypothetical protein